MIINGIINCMNVKVILKHSINANRPQIQVNKREKHTQEKQSLTE